VKFGKLANTVHMPHVDSRCHQSDSAWHVELEFTVDFLVSDFD